MFGKGDMNRDNRLDEKEMSNLYNMMKQMDEQARRHDREQRGGHRKGGHREGGMGMGLDQITRMLH